MFSGWTRPGSTTVPRTVAGVSQCASRCSGYTYFGLECPHSSVVYCQCTNSLAASTPVSSTECSGSHVVGHCVGPFVVGGYLMGAHERGSVYLTGRFVCLSICLPVCLSVCLCLSTFACLSGSLPPFFMRTIDSDPAFTILTPLHPYPSPYRSSDCTDCGTD